MEIATVYFGNIFSEDIEKLKLALDREGYILKWDSEEEAYIILTKGG